MRLGDFGFADSLATMGLSVSVAARGGVRGTYWYMSPEMLKHVLTRARLGSQAGAHATRFSEVYALAITLAVMGPGFVQWQCPTGVLNSEWP